MDRYMEWIYNKGYATRETGISLRDSITACHDMKTAFPELTIVCGTVYSPEDDTNVGNILSFYTHCWLAFGLNRIIDPTRLQFRHFKCLFYSAGHKPVPARAISRCPICNEYFEGMNLCEGCYNKKLIESSLAETKIGLSKRIEVKNETL